MVMLFSKPAVLLALAAPVGALRQGKRQAQGGKVVTMGDSYSSGTGIFKRNQDYEGGDCLQDYKTIPGAQLANQEGLRSVNVACAGGELPDINQQFTDLQADYPQDAASGWNGSVMVFTIGGNDIRTHKGEGWGGLMGSCIASFYGGCHTADENQVANFDELETGLGAFYTRVAEGASKASIRILGYPRLLRRGWICIPVPGLNSGAADWADNLVDEMNGRISRSVANIKSKFPALDIEFVDVVKYLTKGACSTSGQHVHGIVLADGGLSPMTFHPHQRGYNQYYEALGNSLGRSLPPSQVPGGSPVPWEVQHMFNGWDADKTGKLTIEEVLGMGGEDATPDVSARLRAFFQEADKGQDGFLNLEGFTNLLAIVAAAE